MSMKLKRTIQEWRNLDPVNIAQRQGRPVAKHALVDAKHDILALAARVEELEDRQRIEIAPLSLSASLVLPERDVAAPSAQGEPDVDGLVTLLEHAQCPNCDGSGARHDSYGEPEQCQWCHERAEALAAHRKNGGGK